jgi:hypothetical protein
MNYPKSSLPIILIMLFAGCAQQSVTEAPDGREALPDGDYKLVLSAGGGHGECQRHFPEGRQQAFSVVGGTVEQEKSPFIRVRSRGIKIYGDAFSASMTGPFVVQSKIAMTFEGRRIDNGFQGDYKASTGFDSCSGKFQLTRSAS